MSTDNKGASWSIRLAAVALTLLTVVVVFAVKFSAHGNEMKAVFAASLPVAGGVVAAFLAGLIKRFAAKGGRWTAYLYVLMAIAIYLVVVEYL